MKKKNDGRIVISVPNRCFKWPETLAALIEWVGMIKPERKLPPFEKAMGDRFESDLRQLAQSEWPLDDMVGLLNARRPGFRDVFNQAFGDLPPVLHIPAEYRRFREARMILHELAQALAAPTEYRRDVLSYEKKKHGLVIGNRERFTAGKWVEEMEDREKSGLGWPSYFTEIVVSINYETGRVEQDRSKDYVTRCLVGADVRKLCECGCCNRLFLANRKDKTVCRPQCGNTLRQRKLRREERERIEEERKAAAKSGRVFTRRNTTK